MQFHHVLHIFVFVYFIMSHERGINCLLGNMPYTSECICSYINCLHVYTRKCTLFEHWPVPTLLSTVKGGYNSKGLGIHFVIIVLRFIRVYKLVINEWTFGENNPALLRHGGYVLPVCD